LPSPSKSRCPTIDQESGTVPRLADDETEAPSICQIAATPPLSRQTMSLISVG
jgi:hypothetical protein